MQKIVSRNVFMFFSAILLLILAALTFFAFWRQAVEYRDEIITEHIAQLTDIFKRIDEQCGIIGFEHQRNYIDFLTVESFIGSEVGSMNLKYPDHWQGPYLEDNPTMQEKYYEILYTNKGYFIVPGNGVQLSDGKVIGKDIVFTQSTDIQDLIDKEVLKRNGNILAAKLTLQKS